MNAVDLTLYVLVDPARSGGHALAYLAVRAVEGGATLIQYRNKNGSTRAMVDEVRAIRAALAGRGVPVLVNDRVDVALAAGADGVHVGQDDMSAHDARRLLGPGAIIGLTIKNASHVDAAPLDVIDYACIGGVFQTTSKDNPDAPVGLAGFGDLARRLRQRTPAMPIGAIAGIDVSNAADIARAGADGIAVISAVSEAADPVRAAAALRHAFLSGLQP